MKILRFSAAPDARHCVVGGLYGRLVGLLAALWIGGCTALSPAPAAAPSAGGPAVQLEVVTAGHVQPGSVQPGDVIEMRVAAADGSPAAAYRLSIEGAGTGWRDQKELPGPELRFSWVAGEPGAYEVVGQVRDPAGAVGESRRRIVVMPYAAPQKTGGAGIVTTKVTLPTYPLENYQTPAVDPVYRWPYLVFDRERFLAEVPQPSLRDYQLLVLENDYLQVSILPELGGRIWQVLHKPSGDTMFYQNNVVKPSPWGPPRQGGWLGLGGLEWGLPVIEHGYDWGTPWEVTPFTLDDGAVGVTIATPQDGRLLSAQITVTLPPNVAYLEIEPAVRNLAAHTLFFNYWQTAMLAPGAGNRPSAELHFVIPGEIMTVHSTGDTALPGPQRRFTWPDYFGRDLSRLGNWDHYLGFFEYPAAHGPFVGVYDPFYDAGAVRAYPAQVTRGSKVFGLGWRRAIGSENYTDDDSAYVELHAGLAPSFFVPYSLPAEGMVSWAERWYPVYGIGDMVYANRAAALNVTPLAEGLAVALYAPMSIQGTLVADDGTGGVTRRMAVSLGPEHPFRTVLKRVGFGPALRIRLEDDAGRELLTYTPAD
ncbi:MAG: DUF5107 domain-containing protein [Caldilineaceae bacterium]|nr:DUF5107 domain-containing protein [Caldilineaceae bacterium]